MKKLLRNKLLGAACLLLLPLGAGAQVQLDSVGRDAKYVSNIIARSQMRSSARIRLSVMRNFTSIISSLLPIWKTISQRSR